MGIKDLSAFASRDVYLDYDFEEVTYRWDHLTQTAYVRFYGADESARPVSTDNRLYNDAVLYGREITKDEYEKGFPRR
ncbi:hypothetical protein [Pseudomonas sp. Pseu.R1]|uniref:hypothetical protein n=1 Tax=Pseudomonas sp. Pseu.R1 TaxID=3379818 RepID=UPI003B936825